MEKMKSNFDLPAFNNTRYFSMRKNMKRSHSSPERRLLPSIHQVVCYGLLDHIKLTIAKKIEISTLLSNSENKMYAIHIIQYIIQYTIYEIGDKIIYIIYIYYKNIHKNCCKSFKCRFYLLA